MIPWRPLRAVLWDSIQSVIHLHHNRPGSRSLPSNGVPLFVMLPLDVASPKPEISPDKLQSCLKCLINVGVHGVMVDVWWRLCEPKPGIYDFSKYVALARTCRSMGLKLQAVMSFHACGGNVGDAVNIPLPEWVLSAGEIHQFWFTDRAGNINREYISFGADHKLVLPAVQSTKDGEKEGSALRTPLQAYRSFIKAFVQSMDEKGLMGETVIELQIGMGPCGELRYPSYPLSRWKFPGIGEFQCYDRYLLQNLKETVRENGDDTIRAATFPPDGTGNYNDAPSSTQFFRHDMHTPRGSFFLKWYSDQLLQHGEDVLMQARDIVAKDDCDVTIAVKISGIHWWKLSRSRAAEATCGYITANAKARYKDIAELLSTNEAILDFTCLEMRTIDQPLLARCGPRQLVAEVFECASRENVAVAGENALQDFGSKAFQQIAYSMRSTKARKASFTLLRLCNDLMLPENLKRLEQLVLMLREIENEQDKYCIT